jgi:hypothetical protein
MKGLRKTRAVFCVLIAIAAVYTVWDMGQARSMAAHASRTAIPGKSIDEYLSAIPRADYRIIRNDSEITLVPGRGMGRYRCIVRHDGRVITGSITGSMD